jgi:hypothetical protein
MSHQLEIKCVVFESHRLNTKLGELTTRKEKAEKETLCVYELLHRSPKKCRGNFVFERVIPMHYSPPLKKSCIVRNVLPKHCSSFPKHCSFPFPKLCSSFLEHMLSFPTTNAHFQQHVLSFPQTHARISSIRYWEAHAQSAEQNATKRTLLLGRIRMATANLYALVNEHGAGAGHIERIPSTELQLMKIQVFIKDLEDVVNDFEAELALQAADHNGELLESAGIMVGQPFCSIFFWLLYILWS